MLCQTFSQKKRRLSRIFFFHELFMSFSGLHSVYKCTHSCRKQRHTLPLSYACATQRYLQHERTMSACMLRVFQNPALGSTETPIFPPIICLVIEFTQFTGITFGKAKGRLEVIVSGWVSGWPLGRGGRNDSHRGSL